MKVMMMLADHAQNANGKLFISGGGLSTVASGTPFAIALLIEVPWDQANEKHHFLLRLVDEDGKPVDVSGPAGSGPFEIGASFEVGRPPGTKKGSNLPFPLSINFGSMPLQPEKGYVWSLSVDDKRDPDWQLAFTAVAPMHPPGFPSAPPEVP